MELARARARAQTESELSEFVLAERVDLVLAGDHHRVRAAHGHVEHPETRGQLDRRQAPDARVVVE